MSFLVRYLFISFEHFLIGLFIFFFFREGEREKGGERERETLKQASHPARSPMQDLILKTLRS